MITIWKFPITDAENQIITMPKNAKILTVQMQGGQPCLWAVVGTEAKTGPRLIITVGTGNDCAHVAGRSYIGTYQTDGGQFIWHVFA